MPNHLLLPVAHVVTSRRQLGGGGTLPQRNPFSHGQRLQQEISHVQASVRPRRVVEGVDPRTVFKISANSRLSDNEISRRGLQLFGDTKDWTYFVVPSDGDPQSFERDLNKYSEGEAIEGGEATYRGFFNVVDSIAPYDETDRRGPGIPDDPEELAEAIVVDVIVWPSATRDEASRRIEDVRRALRAYDGTELAVDVRPQTTVVRARVLGPCLSALLSLVVVERIRTPFTPFLSPADWLSVGVDDLQHDGHFDEAIGVIDDGVTSGIRCCPNW